MKNKTNVLVTGVGGDVGQGIVKCLKDSGLNLHIIGTCVFSMSAWLYCCNKGYLMPFVSEGEKYLNRLIDICKKERIDIILPGVDAELLLLSKNKEKIEKKTNAIVYVIDYADMQTYCDKYKTYKHFRKNMIPYPETILLSALKKVKSSIEKYKFPLFLKKRDGQGNRNSKLIHSFSDLDVYIGNSNFILQEYLSNSEEEFTSGVYVGIDNEIKGICTLKRELRGGTTYRAEVVKDDNITRQIKDIALKMKIQGYFNIQSRATNGKIIPFEVNPRFSGTSSIISKFAFNGPKMVIEEKVYGRKLKKNKNVKTGYVSRYLNEVYIEPEKLNELVNNNVVINK